MKTTPKDVFEFHIKNMTHIVYSVKDLVFSFIESLYDCPDVKKLTFTPYLLNTGAILFNYESIIIKKDTGSPVNDDITGSKEFTHMQITNLTKAYVEMYLKDLLFYSEPVSDMYVHRFKEFHSQFNYLVHKALQAGETISTDTINAIQILWILYMFESIPFAFCIPTIDPEKSIAFLDKAFKTYLTVQDFNTFINCLNINSDIAESMLGNFKLSLLKDIKNKPKTIESKHIW